MVQDRMGQDNTGEACTGRYDTEKDRMGRANRMGQDETGKDNTGDVDLTLSSSVWSCLGVL